MKKYMFLVVVLVSTVVFTGCTNDTSEYSDQYLLDRVASEKKVIKKAPSPVLQFCRRDVEPIRILECLFGYPYIHQHFDDAYHRHPGGKRKHKHI
ncbi:hypothetical protein COB80_00235 [Candidatus Kaiserbacteria bacterium]|nr:MAG: hypothetical protein COB80_00235 [Candidatus Kaiserbacteria bacterium]